MSHFPETTPDRAARQLFQFIFFTTDRRSAWTFPTKTAFRRRIASRVKNPGTEVSVFSLLAEAFNGEEPEVILSKLISQEGRLAARFLNAFDERLLSRR